ncbi:hypothetical protein B7Z17_03110 [Candidatus Saccharibacteria bacterium 32-49-10]|nr:MAG: hypothetical protein B7Z17_03110 [Candidatus Saccharibacteria bacterium 32-49-10]
MNSTLILIAIIALAALIHASFQLSVSVLTLMSGHAIGARASHARLLRITSGFILGAFATTMLVVAFLAYASLALLPHVDSRFIWALIAGLMIGLGVAVWLFYYRRSAGTTLWIPRGMARFLGERAKKTTHASEGFSLGSTSVFAELIFTIAPAAATAYALARLPLPLQLSGIIGYTIIATAPLLAVYLLVGGGHKLSRIQKWRENNKRFLQFAAGSALVILGFFVYVYEVVGMFPAGGF